MDVLGLLFFFFTTFVHTQVQTFFYNNKIILSTAKPIKKKILRIILSRHARIYMYTRSSTRRRDVPIDSF